MVFLNLKNKIIFFLAVGISVISLVLLVAKLTDFEQLESATVNPNNGDLSAVYIDSERDGICIVSYDCHGNKLYGKFVYSKGGSARLAYEDDLLYVYVYRTNSILIYDRDGTRIMEISENRLTEDQKKQMNLDAWEHWSKNFGTYTYQSEALGLKYVYKEETSVFKNSKCVLYIEDSNGEQIICYHDNWE